MSFVPDRRADPPTWDDLRRLEVRVDARLQEMNARLVLQAGRIAAMGDRIDQTNRRCEGLAVRADTKAESVDRGFDTLGNWLGRLVERLDGLQKHVNGIDDRLPSRRRLRLRRAHRRRGRL